MVETDVFFRWTNACIIKKVVDMGSINAQITINNLEF